MLHSPSHWNEPNPSYKTKNVSRAQQSIYEIFLTLFLMKKVILLFSIVILALNCSSQDLVKRSNTDLLGVKESYFVLKADKETMYGLYSMTKGKKIYKKGYYDNGKKVGFWAYYINNDLQFIYDFDTGTIVTDTIGKVRYALFSEGTNYFYHLIDENLVYPKEAKEALIQGEVVVQFLVDTDGTPHDFCLKEGCGDLSLNKEALRLVEKISLEYPWYPAVDAHGNKVPSVKYESVSFLLRLQIESKIY